MASEALSNRTSGGTLFGSTIHGGTMYGDTMEPGTLAGGTMGSWAFLSPQQHYDQLKQEQINVQQQLNGTTSIQTGFVQPNQHSQSNGKKLND